MAEVLGAVASVVTLTHAAIVLVKQVKTFYQAQAELDVLQEQLENFTTFLTELQSQLETLKSPIIATYLSQATNTIEKLKLLIQVKILRNVNGSSRARRRSWAKNKSKICSIRESLKEYRENLSAAIGASNLQCARRSETALTVISKEVVNKNGSILSIDRRLSEIHQIMLETQKLVRSQPESFHTIMHNTSTLECSHTLQTMMARPPLLCYPDGTSLQIQEEDSCSFKRQEEIYLAHSCASVSMKSHPKENDQDESELPIRNLPDSSDFVGPMGCFETSSNFFPEAYTLRERMSTTSLVVAEGWETNYSMLCKTNIYRFKYLKKRKWVNLEISLRIPTSSKYWQTTKLSHHQQTFAPMFRDRNLERMLPKTLHQGFLDYLAHTGDDDVDDEIFDGILQLQLTDEDTIQIPKPGHMFSTALSGRRNSTSMSTSILKSLDNLGCRQLFESEIIHVDLIIAPGRLASLIRETSNLVLEMKFFGEYPKMKDLYDIQVLRAMEGVPGFCKLAGIVVDNTATNLRSYLVELPQTKWNFISDMRATFKEITWERQENIARQVVEGVLQLHSKSLVAGILWRSTQPIIVDDLDNVWFWTFEKQLQPYKQSKLYPPEYDTYLKHLPSAATEVDFPHVTPEADIFLLGMTLFYLAAGKYTPDGIWEPTSSEMADGDSPTILPPEIPQYYRDIVSDCRSTNPIDRPSAWKILQRFPPRKSATLQDNNKQPRRHDPRTAMELNLNSMKRAFTVISIYCDRCYEFMTGVGFLCTLCRNGGYDVCPGCYEKGLHCLDESHLLVQVDENVEGWSESNKYYSFGVGSSPREVIEL